MVLISRVAAGLAVTGLAVTGLTYTVALPAWLAFAYLVVAGVTVSVGFILCYPYLEIRGYPGFTLGSKAGDPPRWLTVLMVVTVLAAVLLIVMSGADHGTPERGAAGEYVLNYKGTTAVGDQAEWLRAGTRGIRVVIGIVSPFVCGIALWCAAAANARPNAA
jgi:hypothetical protein